MIDIRQTISKAHDLPFERFRHDGRIVGDNFRVAFTIFENALLYRLILRSIYER
jgi:hypothetical protein